jgi:DNA repair protein RecO (recombination protein O)
MAHTKYTTDAWVIARAPTGESNIVVTLYTHDFGAIEAVARSVREQRSRLRQSLATGARSDVSLVRGRYQWRLVSARQRMYIEPVSIEARAHRSRILRLVKRLTPAQEQNQRLFAVITRALTELGVERSIESWSGFELVCASAILAELGYLPAPALADSNYLDIVFAPEALIHAHQNRQQIAARINAALAASQL